MSQIPGVYLELGSDFAANRAALVALLASAAAAPPTRSIALSIGSEAVLSAGESSASQSNDEASAAAPRTKDVGLALAPPPPPPPQGEEEPFFALLARVLASPGLVSSIEWLRAPLPDREVAMLFRRGLAHANRLTTIDCGNVGVLDPELDAERIVASATGELAPGPLGAHTFCALPALLVGNTGCAASLTRLTISGTDFGGQSGAERRARLIMIAAFDGEAVASEGDGPTSAGAPPAPLDCAALRDVSICGCQLGDSASKWLAALLTGRRSSRALTTFCAYNNFLGERFVEQVSTRLERAAAEGTVLPLTTLRVHSGNQLLSMRRLIQRFCVPGGPWANLVTHDVVME